MQQESQSFKSSERSPAKSLPESVSIQPFSERQKCQILAKKGFLVARNTTLELVLLIYSKEFQLGVLLPLPGPDALDSGSQTFAKSAIAMILAEFETLGVARKRLVTYVIGGSATESLPEVAKLTVQRTLWSYGLPLSACDLGGRLVRSVWMDVETGRTIVRSEPMLNDPVTVQSPLPVAS